MTDPIIYEVHVTVMPPPVIKCVVSPVGANLKVSVAGIQGAPGRDGKDGNAVDVMPQIEQIIDAANVAYSRASS